MILTPHCVIYDLLSRWMSDFVVVSYMLESSLLSLALTTVQLCSWHLFFTLQMVKFPSLWWFLNPSGGYLEPFAIGLKLAAWLLSNLVLTFSWYWVFKPSWKWWVLQNPLRLFWFLVSVKFCIYGDPMLIYQKDVSFVYFRVETDYPNNPCKNSCLWHCEPIFTQR